MQTTVFAIVTIIMGISSLFFGREMVVRHGHERGHAVTVFFITATAFSSYLAMLFGQTHITFADGRGIFLARYFDWLITTPLLLVSVAYLALGSISSRAGVLAAIIGADVYMIVTGLAGAVSDGYARWTWYVVSCAAFVGVLSILWNTYARIAESNGRRSAYTPLVALLTVLWVQYPAVWLLGEEGLRIITEPMETAWFAALDVTAKVVFGGFSIVMMRRLATANLADAPETAPQANDGSSDKVVHFKSGRA